LRLLAIAVGLLLAALALMIASGYVLSAPARRPIARPPSDITAEDVTFLSDSGSELHGWLTRAQPSEGVIILLHGVHADRSSQIDRLRFFVHAGYSVLAFDFQAHGESQGRRITFGHLEALDVVAAVNFSRRVFPGEPIGLVGQSLGGAAILLAPQPLLVDAIVLESVYPDIEHALRDRFRVYLGRAGDLLTPLYLALMPFVINVHASELRPIDHIAAVRAPLLILAGTADDRTTIDEARDLFSQAREPKGFWAVDGAGHVNLFNSARADYERHVLPFFAKHLRTYQ